VKFTQPEGQNPLDNGLVVGKPVDRIDGPLKVSGRAPYSFEYHMVAPNPAYGWIVLSGIAKGRIASIDLRQAKSSEGVLLIYTHENVPNQSVSGGSLISQLTGPDILHHGQPVAFVVAETLEQARAAAALVKVNYEVLEGRYDLKAQMGAMAPPPEDASGFGDKADTQVGNFDEAFAIAPITVDATYTTPDQHPAMMEPQATTAMWKGDHLTIYTSNQMANWVASAVASMVGVPRENVRAVCAFVGGGFGSKLRTYADATLSAFAARDLNRPVKTAIGREQLLNHTIRRGGTIQRIRLGATLDGRLTAIGHETWTSVFPGKPMYEAAGEQTRMLYAASNRMTAHRVAPLDLVPPSSMRAPSTATGQLTFEIAMDEMAEKLQIDPVELRILNDIQHDPEVGPSRPYSDRKLVECLREGARRFGWEQRVARPGQVRDGRWLIGMGMASSMHHHGIRPSNATLRIDQNGALSIETSMTDIGTGTYTALAQIAAEMTGIPMHRIRVSLGDTAYAMGAGSIASIGLSSAGASVYYGCQDLRLQLARRAGINPDTAVFRDGFMWENTRSYAFGALAGEHGIEVTGSVQPGGLGERTIQAAFGAHFCEVGVDMDTGETRVRRMLGVFAAGRIINQKMARSQAIGGMVFGIGAALTEDAVVDPRHGYFVNHDMAEYHVPVHADVPAIDAIYLDDADALASPIATKGVGELGTCGSGAAVANAIYNATGARVRSYPITLDKLLDALPEQI
jgi:xanthine dehydrogenase YagR molybdenum-binding subunit